jgi:hypothetical protein
MVQDVPPGTLELRSIAWTICFATDILILTGQFTAQKAMQRSISKEFAVWSSIGPSLKSTRALSKKQKCRKSLSASARQTQEGDFIVVLYGCSVPVVLRPVYSTAGTPDYQFIGEAFVYGMMDGEAFDMVYEETAFKLI